MPIKSVFRKKIGSNPVLRFDNSFQKLGAQVRPKDERTPEQLRATLDYLAEKNPAVKEFLDDLKSMEPKFMALASDTIELANRKEMLMTNVNMNKTSDKTGKSLLQYLLSIYPKAAKENPQSMDFAQEVINNTDTLTAKYFFANMNGLFETPEVSKHLEATKPLVKDFAESTLNGGYLGTFERQQNFIDLICTMLNPKAKPEKISLLSKLMEVVDKISHDKQVPITLDKFVTSDTPVAQVKANMRTLPNAYENSIKEGKQIDVVDFVNCKNI